jgi:ribose transport system ATP-binding protein
VARLLFGADKRKSGDLQWLGKTVDFSSPREAIKAGICFLTEDRKTQGLVLGMNVRENISLPTLQEFTRYLFVDSKKEKRVAGESIQELNIKTPSTETSVNSLSGGNQQKVVLAKWLLSQAKLFIFDEPTRGIDVGAKREIYILMNELLRRGAGILMISSELPEVLGMSDRVLVMSEGHLVCELSRDEASQEAIMQAATQQRIPV